MIKKVLKHSLIALIWLLIWQAISSAVGEELLLPAPLTVAKRLIEFLVDTTFYKTVGASLLRILLGMISGTVIGALGGLFTAFSKPARAFFAPALAIIKSTPVASFIFLMVLWLSREMTPPVISAMMVIPIVWSNVETGFLNTDRSLLEMAGAYKMSALAKMRHIYLPSISPYFFSSLRSSLGMAWKAGIAAEVLLLPLVSIGKMIFESKNALETVDLFAWTVVMIILSVIIEKVMVLILKLAVKDYSFDGKGGATVG